MSSARAGRVPGSVPGALLAAHRCFAGPGTLGKRVHRRTLDPLRAHDARGKARDPEGVLLKVAAPTGQDVIVGHARGAACHGIASHPSAALSPPLHLVPRRHARASRRTCTCHGCAGGANRAAPQPPSRGIVRAIAPPGKCRTMRAPDEATRNAQPHRSSACMTFRSSGTSSPSNQGFPAIHG